jgi:hypothetical protein
MKPCPTCGERPISWWNWAKGLHWYQTRCEACDEPLKASSGTWLAIVLTFVSAGTAGGFCQLYVTSDTTETTLAVSIVTGIAFASLSYFVFAGYVAARRVRRGAGGYMPPENQDTSWSNIGVAAPAKQPPQLPSAPKVPETAVKPSEKPATRDKSV